MTIVRINPCARWSDATLYQGLAHFVEVPADTSEAAAGQIIQLLAQAELTLAQLGSDKSRLLSVTMYITAREDLGALNQAWEAWLPPHCAPARACVMVELLDPHMRIEIAFVAAVNEAKLQPHL